MLILSGVLKRVVEQDPSWRINLVRRTSYLSILGGHEAVGEVGFAPADARTTASDYWAKENLGPGNQRPFQILARAFGLETPVPERLYLPGGLDDDPVLHDFLPWKPTNVMVVPTSDSRRKMARLSFWEELVQRLQGDDVLVLQIGRRNDPRVRHAYCLLGLTTPRQALSLMAKCDLVITLDSFALHGAHLVGTPTVALWGPTHHAVYGWPGQRHLQLPKACGLDELDECIGPKRNDKGRLYNSACPEGDRHCLDQLGVDRCLEVVHEVLAQSRKEPA